MTSPYRPPSCDLPPEHFETKLKPCPFCEGKSELIVFNQFVICSDLRCRTVGPNNDPHGHKWNSIPRRSEVMELLRLVESVHKNLPGPPNAWGAMRNKLIAYADKLMKEIRE